MKILYDHQIFSIQIFGGISRYFKELSSQLDAKKNIRTEFALKISNNFYLEHNRLKFYNFLRKNNFRGKVRIIYFVNRLYTIYKLNKRDFDVFHPTYYDTYFLKFIGNRKFVLTVYDMIHEKFPMKFSEYDKTSKNKEILANKAAKIIAISESTKKDLIEIFNINPSKIEVIYLANSLQLNKKIDNKIKLPKKYILYVGSRGGYKNFMNFLSSVTKILNSDNNLHLVCAGGGKFDDQENAYISKNNLEYKLLQFNIDDKTLSYFYSNAKAFIFPSLYEGFGIPVLEAFACGCPLICSNTSSLPEIASDAAVYFDPLDEKSIETAVFNVLNHQELSASMIEKGYKRLEYFSWEKTAQLTEKIYQSII